MDVYKTKINTSANEVTKLPLDVEAAQINGTKIKRCYVK